MTNQSGGPNSLSLLANGDLRIGEKRLNAYLSILQMQGARVSCTCEALNHLWIRIETKSQGILHIQLQVSDFQHDSTQSFVRFKLLDRRLDGNSLKAMLFEKLPGSALKYLLELFALPQTIKVAKDGDYYSVDFHIFLMQSAFAEEQIMGVRAVDCIKIKGMEIDTGRISLFGSVDFNG